MSKKRYVKKQQVLNKSQRKTNETNIKLETFNSDEEISGKQFDLKFDDKKILHLWLVEILPGKYSQFKINLQSKKIIGKELDCEKKLTECHEHIDKHTFQVVKNEEQELKDQFIQILYIKFNAKVFHKKIIQAACKEIKDKYNYDAILKIIESITGFKYYYLISISKEIVSHFTKWFEQNKQVQFTKQDVMDIRNQLNGTRVKKVQSKKVLTVLKQSPLTQSRAKQKKQTNLKDDEQKQSSVREQSSQQSSEEQVSFYTINQSKKATQNKANKNSQKSQGKIQKGQNDAEAQKTQEKKKYKQKNVKNYHNQETDLLREPNSYKKIFSKIYQQKIFNLDLFKMWVKNNRLLKLVQFQFSKSANNIQISLLSSNDIESKLQTLKIYFQHVKVILIEQLSKQNRQSIQKQFCKKNIQSISCNIVDGFMEPSTHEHKLRNLIMQGKIIKSQRNSKKFYAVLIKGLKPLVEKIQEQIRNFIIQLPQNDKQEIIFLNLPKLQEYLIGDRQEKISNLIRNAYKKKIQEFPNISLVDIFFPNTKIALKLNIKYEQYDEFMERGKEKLNKLLSSCIIVTEMVNEDDMSKDLLQKYLLVRSIENQKMFSLISQSDTTAELTKQIYQIVHKNNSQMKESKISFKNGRLQKLKDFIEEIKSKKQLKTDQVKFSFEKQNRLQIFGTNKIINIIQPTINEYLNKLEGSIVRKTFYVTDTEAIVIEKNVEKFKEQIKKNFKLSFNLTKNIDFGAIFSLGDSKNLHPSSPLMIMIQKHKNIFRLPNQSVIFFQSLNDINFFNAKELMQVKATFYNKTKNSLTTKNDQQRDYFYIYSQKFLTIMQMVTQVNSKYPYQNPQGTKTFAFVMPKDNKSKFVLQILQAFQDIAQSEPKNKMRIFIFQQTFQDIKKALMPVEQAYNKLQSKYQYYVFDKKQYYYSKEGDSKINHALSKGEHLVYLTNQDLNMEIITHDCCLKDKKIIHKQSGKQTPIQQNGNNIYYTVKNIKFQLPASQTKILLSSGNNPVQLSIGAYELDFNKMIQTNMFSGFTRRIQKKQISIPKKNAGKLYISFDQRVNEIQIPHQHKQEIHAVKSCQRLKQLIQAEKIIENHTLEKSIQKETFQTLQSIAKELDTEIQWDGQTKLTVSSFDKGNLGILLKNIKFFVSEQKKQIKYPSTWIQQKSQIETFVVSADSNEFKQVQAKFTVTTIKQLVRIQNTLVYKKYADEKQFLKRLNGGKDVKQMMLFHGTKTTDPKLIYEDKQQCFNINYTSDSNYLGRGTYFAQTPQYSHNYAHVSNNGIFGNLMNSARREMFYCSVLVGDSQKIMIVTNDSQNMKDTGYKNPTQKIRFQSATMFTNGSNIYTVYKNRRAYPLYLIRY